MRRRFLQAPPQRLKSSRAPAGSDRAAEVTTTANNKQPQRVDQQMPLASLHFLTRIIATHPGQLRRFDALTIEDASGGMLMATCTLAYLGPQRLVTPTPRAIIAKRAKVAIDALPGRILSWQHPPVTPRDGQIQDRIDHRAHVQRAWVTSRFCRRDQVFDPIPLKVGQIGGIQLVLVHIQVDPFPDRHPFSNSL